MALTDAQKAKIIKLGQLSKFKELADLRYQTIIEDLSTIRSGASAGATAYQKPSTGIPSTDLASAVQSALEAAGTALQAADLATLEGKVAALESLIDEGENPTAAIDKFNEIVAFLDNITNTDTLDGILSGINTSIAAKYTKPSGGIPKTDLAQGVQDSLDAADSAYQKPSTGIPSTDMSSAVQASLALADSALQSHQDISGKADKSEMSVTPGTGNDADKTTIQLKSGTSATVLTTHQDISGKVDKVNGKGLSTNDYSDADKAKVDTIEYATDSDVEALF